MNAGPHPYLMYLKVSRCLPGERAPVLPLSRLVLPQCEIMIMHWHADDRFWSGSGEAGVCVRSGRGEGGVVGNLCVVALQAREMDPQALKYST